ncbi:hypothetical protein G6F61_003788 [Rhizopus arrhizus]|nr:hypothetical protein G6F61_003788 [Rhizopus arrhizus]
MSTQSNEQNTNSQPRQFLTLERQEEQALFLEPFYTRLTERSFDQSKSAIEFCRDLCAEFGFTVKQEASTHRNIYVYCSREGLPDSLRNPRPNPQRKRPSKRCDCRWRVVLYESDGHWEFRKSLNPEAGKHNHELMRPEEIERSWPKEVIDLICELARLRMTTQDIRTRVQAQFPDIHWNERRFYNRLSEERQKIKQRDATERTHDLFQIWSKICTITAGSEELSHFVKHELSALYQTLVQTTQVDDSLLPDPAVLSDDGSENKEGAEGAEESLGTSTMRRPSKQVNGLYRGYLQVEIPKQTYYIKTHSQRLIQDGQLLRGHRRSRTSEDAQALEPVRKQPRKGKGKESALLPADDPLPSDRLFQLTRAPYSNSSRANSTPNTPRVNTAPIMKTNPSQPHNQRQAAQIHPASFVYTYDSNNMSLSSPLSGYVHPQFSDTYMSATHNSSSFNATDMQFQFNPSQTPMVRTSSAASNTTNNPTDPTMHPALQSHPMSNKAPLTQPMPMQPTAPPVYHNTNQQTAPPVSRPHSDINSDASTNSTNAQHLYSMHPSPGLPDPSAEQPSHGTSSQIAMYESPQERMRSSSSVEAQQQATYNHNLYMHQAASHHPSDTIMPIYNQSSPSQEQANDGPRMNRKQT